MVRITSAGDGGGDVKDNPHLTPKTWMVKAGVSASSHQGPLFLQLGSVKHCLGPGHRGSASVCLSISLFSVSSASLRCLPSVGMTTGREEDALCQARDLCHFSLTCVFRVCRYKEVGSKGKVVLHECWVQGKVYVSGARGCRQSSHIPPPPCTPSLGGKVMGPVVRAAEPLPKDTRGATDCYGWLLGVSGRCLWLPQVSEKLRAGERAPGSP